MWATKMTLFIKIVATHIFNFLWDSFEHLKVCKYRKAAFLLHFSVLDVKNN